MGKRPVDLDSEPAEAERATVDDFAGDEELDEADVYLPGQGKKVRIRALTRDEAIKIAEATKGRDRECKMISWSLVDPELNYQQVDRWLQRSAAGDAQVLADAIAELSGLGAGARKEETQRFRGES